MIIYKGTVSQFKSDIIYGLIADKLESLFSEKHLPHNSRSEHRSWENSLAVMRDVLSIAKTDDDVNVSIEYQIPLTSKRVDFLLSGLNENGNENVVVVELKQWDDCQSTTKDSLVMAFTGGSMRLVTHPSYQASSYADTIYSFNEEVREKDISIFPCAFCHNFEEKNRSHIDSPFYSNITKDSPIYLKEDRIALASFIKKYISKTDNGKGLMDIEYGRIKPSKALQNVVGSMLKGNKEFSLIDEQKVAYERTMELIENSVKDGKKRTIIIRGGPGTGKSVLAINLLAKTVRASLLSFYVSKNSAPREVYFEEIKRNKTKIDHVKALFKGSGAFVNSKENEFDCLIVDEAHRLKEHSGLFNNQGTNQIKEIIHAARTSIFFLDEDQIVTMFDIGTPDEIKKWAKEEGSIVYDGVDFVLPSQFRCNGSDGYLAFIDNALEIRETANPFFEGIDFDFRVFDDPNEMKEELRKKNSNNRSRMLAGYCYKWVSQKDRSAFDIVLKNDFKAQWNFNNTSTWAIDPDSFDQVGCIHTSQGLEFDYVGVIIGQDLRYENGHIVTDYKQRAPRDKTMEGIKSMQDKSIAIKIIKDTYKVLMTRGQKGCFVYCEDPALSNYLKSLIKETKN